MIRRASFSWRQVSSVGLNSRAIICNKRNCHHERENTMVKIESLEIKRNRLQYQSRKRGMLENCILFSTFSEKFLASLTPIQLEQYDSLLNGPSNDWDIYYWATGLKETPPEYKNEIMDLFSKHVKNYEKQARPLLPKLLTD